MHYAGVSSPGHKIGLVCKNHFFLWEKAWEIKKDYPTGWKWREMAISGDFESVEQCGRL